MEINVPLRIVILAPSILFFVTFAWSWIFRGHLTNRIVKEGIAKRSRKVSEIIDLHFVESLLAEATVVFLVNGLTILLVLEDEISGALQMIIGVILSISLLLYLLTSEHEKTLPLFAFALSLVLGFVGGQLLFLWYYGTGPTFLPWFPFVFMTGGMSIVAVWLRKRTKGR